MAKRRKRTKRPSKASIERDLAIKEMARQVGQREGEAKARAAQDQAKEQYHLQQFVEQIDGCQLSSSAVLIGAETQGDKTKLLSVPLAQLRLIADIVRRELI